MPSAQLLSMMIMVGGCRWPRLSRVLQNTVVSLVARKSAPSLAFVADGRIFSMMVERKWTATLAGSK